MKKTKVKTNKNIITNEDVEQEHREDIRQTNEILTAEDAVQTTAYMMNAPDCCSNGEKLDNMIGMLGADIMDDDVYHNESEHFYMSM